MNQPRAPEVMTPRRPPLRQEIIGQTSGFIKDDAAVQEAEDRLGTILSDAGPDASLRVGDLSDGFFIEDDGPGIDPAVADSLFEPDESGAAGNTEFGLVIVQEIATAHGWTVAATTGADGGARFEVRGVDGHTPGAH